MHSIICPSNSNMSIRENNLSIKPRAAVCAPRHAGAFEDHRDDGCTVDVGGRDPRAESRRETSAQKRPRYVWMSALLAVSVLLLVNQSRLQRLSGRLIANRQNTSTTPWTLDRRGRIVVPKDMILIRSSLLWCPNAKSGTSTVYNVLQKNKLIDKRCYRNCDSSAWKHVKQWPREKPKPVSFVIVRNPWDRLRSAYVDKIASGKISVSDKRGKITTFARFAKYAEKHYKSNMHWRPVSHRCHAGKGKGGGFQYDYVLKLEDSDMNERLQEIFDRAGIELPVGIDNEIKNQKSTNHTSRALVDFYRKEAEAANMTMAALVAKVGKIYRDDIEPFGYSFPAY